MKIELKNVEDIEFKISNKVDFYVVSATYNENNGKEIVTRQLTEDEIVYLETEYADELFNMAYYKHLK